MKKRIVLLFAVIVCSFKFYDALIAKASMGQGRGQRGNYHRGNGNVSRGRGRGNFRGRGNPRVSSLGERQSIVGATGGIEESHLTNIRANLEEIPEPQLTSNVVKLDSTLEDQVKKMSISETPLQEPVVRRKPGKHLLPKLGSKEGKEESTLTYHHSKESVKALESKQDEKEESIRQREELGDTSLNLQGASANLEEPVVRRKTRKYIVSQSDPSDRELQSVEEIMKKYSDTSKYVQRKSSTYPYIKLSKFKAEVLADKWEEYFKTLNKEEQEALRIYTTNNEDITKYLSGDKKITHTQGRDIDEVIKNLDSALSKYNLENDFIVYRGDNKKYYEKLKPGDILSPGYYWSTSGDKYYATKFTKSKEKRENPIMIIIRVPKSSKAIYVGRGIGMSYSKEFILDRMNKYKVLSFNGNELELEVVQD